MENIVWVWLAAMVVFLILELLSPTFIFACFVVGSLVSGIVSWFAPEAYYWQFGVFALASIGLIPLTRSFARKITADGAKSNVDALIGKVGIVTKPIDPDLGGQVRLESEIWLASSETAIAVDEKIVVLRITGTKVHVERKQ